MLILSGRFTIKTFSSSFSFKLSFRVNWEPSGDTFARGQLPSAKMPVEKKSQFFKMLCSLERGLTFDDDYLTHREDTKVHDIKENQISETFVPNATRELLIWSVVINEPSLTRFFLEGRSDCGLQDRFMCATMFRMYACKVKISNPGLAEDMIKTKTAFLQDALQIMDNANSMSHHKASLMVRKQCPRWGNLSMLEMCSKAGHLRFFEHSLIQGVISKVWYGRVDIRNTGAWSYFISIIPVIGWIMMPIFEWFGTVSFITNNAHNDKSGLS